MIAAFIWVTVYITIYSTGGSHVGGSGAGFRYALDAVPSDGRLQQLRPAQVYGPLVPALRPHDDLRELRH